VTSGRAVKIAACATAAVAGLALAVAAAGRVHSEQSRKPTPAELATAAAAGVAQRWERVPAGQLFPAAIRYRTDLQTSETASREGIDTGEACADAVDGTLTGLVKRDGCVAGLRADYADQLRGSVYTVGILAFGSPAKASAFYARMPLSAYPATGLRALAISGTSSALFGNGARQTSAAQLAGPYVVLAVAGYADGRPAKSADERRDSVFDPVSQLVTAVAAPLAKPVAVRCGTAEWACSQSDAPVPPSTIEQVRPDELKALDQIHAPTAWHTTRGNGVTVAVLDTGVDTAAPDLAGSVHTGPDYTAGADPAGFQPPHLHGTYIASLIAGHGSGPGNQLGVIGVAPGAKILSVRVILDDGEPGTAAYNQDSQFASAIGKGIYYAVRHGAKVINMSLGSEQPTAYLRGAVAYAVAKGVVIVASAGNGGTNSGFAPYVYPASFTGVIAVAAVNGSGQRASFSEQNAAVVLSAPGVNVIGAGPGGEYLDAEGTSPAAALVSGVAALIRSRYPRLSPALVEQALITSATRKPSDGYDTDTGFGVVDAITALKAAARLAGAKPAATFAPAAVFSAASGSGEAQGALGPIRVVHRNTALITGLTVAAGVGALCGIVALVLLTALVRRHRRESQAGPAAGQLAPHPPYSPDPPPPYPPYPPDPYSPPPYPQPPRYPQHPQPQYPQPPRYPQDPQPQYPPGLQPPYRSYQQPHYPQDPHGPQGSPLPYPPGPQPPHPPGSQPPYPPRLQPPHPPGSQPPYPPGLQPPHLPGSQPSDRPSPYPPYSPPPGPQPPQRPMNIDDYPNSWFDPQ
jgi:type VII secretion-associated serine protease mycosin